MALKAGRDGISEVGPGLDFDKKSGRLSLKGESELTLDNLKDVSINEPLEGDVLRYNGEDWENVAPDSDPTDDSANLVTSGGVYEADNNIWAANGVLGAKNLLKVTGATKTENGVTFTVNSDGSISVSAADGATADTYFIINGDNGKYEVGKSYKISGCPSGGSFDTYYMYYHCRNEGNTAWVDSASDTGNGATWVSSTKDTLSQVAIFVKNGVSISTPIVFKPMITSAEDTDDAYVPYAMTNRELTEKVQGIIDAATNAADFAAFKTVIGLL